MTWSECFDFMVACGENQALVLVELISKMNEYKEYDWRADVPFDFEERVIKGGQEKMPESIEQRIEQEQIIDTKYEHLASEYARICGTMKYMLVIKQLDSEMYKSNKVHIDNELERLDIERERILTELENLVNDKESV